MDELQKAIEAMDAALAFIEASPCDPDITGEQWKAWKRLCDTESRAALASLRAMKERSVEGFVVYDTEALRKVIAKSGHVRLYHEDSGVNHDAPALLILEDS